jgi:ELWxxDGT repeat protein
LPYRRSGWPHRGPRLRHAALAARAPRQGHPDGLQQLQPLQPDGPNRTLLFTAGDAANGAELWRSDGTTAGTVVVKDIRPGTAGSNPTNHTLLRGTLFFSANDSTTGRELWKSNGTTAGTVMVADVEQEGIGSNPKDFVGRNGITFFTADDDINGRELWRSDEPAAPARTGTAGSRVRAQESIKPP